MLIPDHTLKPDAVTYPDRSFREIRAAKATMNSVALKVEWKVAQMADRMESRKVGSSDVLKDDWKVAQMADRMESRKVGNSVALKDDWKVAQMDDY
jgi:allophanate hydrolase subunit 2